MLVLARRVSARVLSAEIMLRSDSILNQRCTEVISPDACILSDSLIWSTIMIDNSLLMGGLPMILMIDHESEKHAVLRKILRKSGWELQISKSVDDICRIASEQRISVVLLNLDQVRATSMDSARALRASTAPAAAAPILAWGLSNRDNGPISSYVDATLVASTDHDSLARELDRWRPVSLEPTRRIAAMFGPGPIAGMIERLARRLEPALASLEHGNFDRSEAHRLAGLCGTLGFGQAHAAWLDLSLGDESAIADVRRTTRLVLAAVAHGL